MCCPSLAAAESPKAVIGAAMHKLLHLIFGVLKTRKPFQADWAKTALLTTLEPLANAKNGLLVLDIQDGI